MGLFDLFRAKPAARSTPKADYVAGAGGNDWFDWGAEGASAFIRTGFTASGATVTSEHALRNAAVFRCVDLISSAMGSLPLYIMQRNANGTISYAQDHPLYDLLLHKPNAWQTAQDFRATMQLNVLLEGNAYANIVRSGTRVMQLVPLDPFRVVVTQNADWTLNYKYAKPVGGHVDYTANDILHIRGLSRDGISGMSRTHLAREAIGLALQAELAAARLFKNGTMVGGVVSHPGQLSKEAFDNLREMLNERYASAENAQKTMLLQEGMAYKEISANAANTQQIETRSFQIAEVARVFGVPRPLLMTDETGWGTGIEQLSLLFIKYGLRSWFNAWESAINVSLLTVRERKTLYSDFDEKELLRGSMNDQSSFYSKALGAGGQGAWMTPNEVRNDVGLGTHADGDTLINPMTAQGAPAPTNGGANGV